MTHYDIQSMQEYEDWQTYSQPFQIGQIVRPANDGETSIGRIVKWTRLRGKVVDIWKELEGSPNECWRVEVKWFDPLANRDYGTRMPHYFLTAVY